MVPAAKTALRVSLSAPMDVAVPELLPSAAAYVVLPVEAHCGGIGGSGGGNGGGLGDGGGGLGGGGDGGVPTHMTTIWFADSALDVLVLK